ncbi:histidine phosphatase family protein [Bacillus sp. NPDC077411]|uniref:Phosphoglycerate mutase family protein n=1 Tax=Bacillus bruguierae TaxID=3127667 RepID=A0ABU8FDX9_9BACI
MDILLIRHGKSKFTENNRITCKEFKNWVEKYDYNGVFEEPSYPSETLKKISSANIVITSDLKRSVESAKLLNPKLKAISVSLFRETELPALSRKLLDLKLKPSNWAVILRCLWFCGYSNECESLNNAKRRAKKASQLLIDYARKHKSVALVGHGFFNMLIAKELQRMGWKGKRKTSTKHWGCTIYSL